jgi:hypothetical protein
MQAVPPVAAGAGPPHLAVPPQAFAAPLPPPVAPNFPVGILTPPPTSYYEMYTLPSADPFGGNYINLYHEYNIANTTPNDLRNALYRDGNTGTLLHVLIHVRSAHAPVDDPGLIVAYHRVSRHDTRFGQVATPYDNQGLAFFGDLISGVQAPATVIIPDTLYNQLPVVQVPTHGLVEQELAANPQATLLGPYPAGTNDVDPIITRQLVVVPNCYVRPFLTTGLAPVQAYTLLHGMIMQDGNGVACAPLLDWLRTTLTHRAAMAYPRTCVEPLSAPTFGSPGDQQRFASYRLEILHQDFPHLRPGTHHSSAVLIAQGITALTDEQRLARYEAQQHRADRSVAKTPSEHFGVLFDRLMRWCHAITEADLPPIYERLANIKKGAMRSELQTAVEDTLANLNYLEDFPLSLTLATKIRELKWHSPLKDNFTAGINIFSLGSLDDELIEAQRCMNSHADTIAGGDAAPSLIDIAAIQDGKHDLCIPKTFAQLRYSVERAEALWHVLLGPAHPLTHQHRLFRAELISQEKRLESVVTHNSAYQLIVPALLARVIQLRTNHWLNTQSRSPSAVQPASFVSVFDDIECQRLWEPQFPSRYLSNEMPSRPPPSVISILGDLTEPTNDSNGLMRSSGPPGTVSPSTTSGSTPARAPTPAGRNANNVLVRNALYKTDLYKDYKARNIKSATLKNHLRINNILTPVNVTGSRMCIPYHVLGYCNQQCKLAADHKQHSDAESDELREWCSRNYNLDRPLE